MSHYPPIKTMFESDAQFRARAEEDALGAEYDRYIRHMATLEYVAPLNSVHNRELRAWYIDTGRDMSEDERSGALCERILADNFRSDVRQACMAANVAEEAISARQRAALLARYQEGGQVVYAQLRRNAAGEIEYHDIDRDEAMRLLVAGDQDVTVSSLRVIWLYKQIRGEEWGLDEDD